MSIFLLLIYLCVFIFQPGLKGDSVSHSCYIYVYINLVTYSTTVYYFSLLCRMIWQSCLLVWTLLWSVWEGQKKLSPRVFHSVLLGLGLWGDQRKNVGLWRLRVGSHVTSLLPQPSVYKVRHLIHIQELGEQAPPLWGCCCCVCFSRPNLVMFKVTPGSALMNYSWLY